MAILDILINPYIKISLEISIIKISITPLLSFLFHGHEHSIRTLEQIPHVIISLHINIILLGLLFIGWNSATKPHSWRLSTCSGSSLTLSSLIITSS